jgi:excinuclease ABC subunit C
VVAELEIGDRVELAALAKQFEEVYRPGLADPIRLPRGSEALYLLQRLRDEAHRFAITFHRERRGKRMTVGALDGIGGLGPARKKRLVRELGSVRAVKAATLADLRALHWLPDQVADNVYQHLHRVA